MESKENQSPLRPILKNSLSRRQDQPIAFAIPLRESNDATNRTGDINFSRKRTPVPSTERASIDQARSPHESKWNRSNGSRRTRARSEDHNARRVVVSEHRSQSRESISSRTSSELRASKFREASMRDSPSAKPPSMFLRLMPEIKQLPGRPSLQLDPSGEHLMEAYFKEQQHPQHNNQATTVASTPSLMQTARSATRATQVSGLTHHANASISSSANSTASSSASSRGGQRDSAMFKLGKNVKMAWQNFRSKSAKEQRAKEQMDAAAAAKKAEADTRRLKAEQEYAAFKASTKPTKVTSRMRANTATSILSARPQTQPDGRPHAGPEPDVFVRGRQPCDVLHASDRTNNAEGAPGPVIPQRVSAVPGNRDKSLFHFRTPSMQDLKRLASQTTLHRRAASSAVVLQDSKTVLVTSTASVEVDERPSTSAGFSAYVRTARSRKDLIKEEKLAKRVNELESKLNMARKELEKQRSMELLSAKQPIAPFENEADSAGHARADSRAVTKQSRFQPLPTLQSESLLVTAPDDLVKHEPYAEFLTEHSDAVAVEAVPRIETPKEQVNGGQLCGTPGTEPYPSSAFDSSSESSPEGLLNAFRRHKAAVNNKSEGSPVARKTPRRHGRSRGSTGSIDKSVISAPILADASLVVELSTRASLDTVSEEASIISSMRKRLSFGNDLTAAASTSAVQESSPLSRHVTAMPDHDRNSLTFRPRHRHTRSLSPIKSPRRLLQSLPGKEPSPNQFQHLRARSMSPLPSPPANTALQQQPAAIGPVAIATAINFSRPVTPAAQLRITGVPRLAPRREEWEWPDDVF